MPKFLLFKVTLATTVASNQGGTPSAARVKAMHGAHKPSRVLDANIVADWHRGINCRPEMMYNPDVIIFAAVITTMFTTVIM